MESKIYKTDELFDLTKSLAGEYLATFEYPWQALAGLKDCIRELGKSLPKTEYREISPEVWVHVTATVAPTALIMPPCIIGEKSEVRHCAFIRGSVLVGKNCVVGNSTEVKNAILFDGVQAPHYNYVGDSVLGYKAHLGAGAVTSNVKSDKTPVQVKCGKESLATGMKKFGAALGDFVEVGCNSVLNPGTVVGKHTNIYPLSCVRGVVAERGIFKTNGTFVEKE